MFDWKSKSFPGYRPVREPWNVKIVSVSWMDAIAVEFFDKAT
jgi:hypothetical protein